MTSARALCLTAVVLCLACGHDFEPPDRAEQISAAEITFATVEFDSIVWPDVEARLDVGNLIYAEECRRCHGQLGWGDTEYAAERDLTVPSLVEPDWRLAFVDSVRRHVYVGHESGMPIFGRRDLSLQEIDAVAGYILLVLRPDVLDGGDGAS